MEGAIKTGNMQAIVDGFNRQAANNSIAVNTRATQASAVVAWKRFCEIFNINYLISYKSIEETENIVLSFIGFEIGLRGMNPRSIKDTYLSSINRDFVEKRISNYFDLAIHSNIVRYVLRGYIRIYHLMNPLSSLKKLAFTIELVNHLEPALTVYKPEWNHGLKRRALILALKFGIYFLLRKSEFLPASNNSRGSIRWFRVKFYNALGFQIKWNSTDINSVKSMEINIHRSKTDQHGLSRIVRHTTVNGPNCICKLTFKWKLHCISHASATEFDGIFDTASYGIIVSEDEVARTMKFIVKFLGWDDKKISAHSLRYGGATMLAAAGMPQYVIEYFGGWAKDSQVLKWYTQLGNQAVSRVSQVMSDGHHKSLEESRIRAGTTHV